MGRRKKKNDSTDFLTIILVLLVIVVCVCLAYGGKEYVDDKNQVESSANNKQANTVVSNELKKENANTQNNVSDKKEEEKKEEVKKEETKIENKEDNKKSEEVVSVSSEEKAIELVKKAYGTANGVYFRIEQTQSSDTYVVSVRDESTTAAIDWYTVNVSTGVVE